MVAPSYISVFFKKRAAASETISITTTSERKCAAASEYIFFYVEDCVTASKNISMFYYESVAFSKRYR